MSNLVMTDEIQGAIAAAVASALAAKASGKKSKKARKQGVSRSAVPVEERKSIFVAATIEAFKAAGFTDVVPYENVLSYNKWLEAGFKVKAGEKAVRVKDKLHRRGNGLPLFHRTQVEKVSA